MEPVASMSTASASAPAVPDDSDFVELLTIHRHKLNYFCKLCGTNRVVTCNYNVYEHSVNICKFFQVDVINYHDNIHPKLMCNACYNRIERLKLKDKKRQSTVLGSVHSN